MVMSVTGKTSKQCLKNGNVSDGKDQVQNGPAHKTLVFIASASDVQSRQSLRFSQTYVPRLESSSTVVCATSKCSDQPAHTRRLIRAVACRFNILLTEQHLEFISLNGAAHAHLSLFMLKFHIVGNLVSRLIYAAQQKLARITKDRVLFEEMI